MELEYYSGESEIHWHEQYLSESLKVCDNNCA